MFRWFLLTLMISAFALPALAGDHPATKDHPKKNKTPQTDNETMAPKEVQPFAEFVSPEDSLPRLRFLADGLISPNDRCPVRKVRLNPKMGASYVNGQPVGFC